MTAKLHYEIPLLLFPPNADTGPVLRGAQAAADSVIEEVVVTVTRSGESVQESPYSVHVIDAQTLAWQLVRSLPEALVTVPGVTVQKTANGQGSPFIRGFTGYRTLALIDGIRYNNSVYRDGPNEYFSLIDFNNLERLELLNGPASSAYGSDAIGGTLNLHTKSANYIAETPGETFINGRQSYRFSGTENSHLSRTELAFGEGSWSVIH